MASGASAGAGADAAAAPAAAFAQANMIADLQLLSVGSAEASPTSLVITDKDRYVCVDRVVEKGLWQARQGAS